jgi:hypothetical protein
MVKNESNQGERNESSVPREEGGQSKEMPLHRAGQSGLREGAT